MSIRQQVNLYLPEFRKHSDPLSPERMLVITGVFIGSLLLIQLVYSWNLNDLQQQHIDLQQQHQQLDQRVTQLRQSKPQTQKNRLARQVTKLRLQVERSRRVSAIISGQNLGNTQGFSGYLQGMARQSSNAIAIDQFRLLRGGEYVEFQGWSRRAEAVPRYLQLLRNEPSFEEVKFGVMSIASDDNRKGFLRFSLGQPLTDESLSQVRGGAR